ncbi:MAG: hypothetical protein ACE5I5_15395 [Candidatus Heimdallarchaeota archaeon]
MWRITKRITKRKPVEEYLKYQARYKYILKDEEILAKVLEDVEQSNRLLE